MRILISSAYRQLCLDLFLFFFASVFASVGIYSFVHLKKDFNVVLFLFSQITKRTQCPYALLGIKKE